MDEFAHQFACTLQAISISPQMRFPDATICVTDMVGRYLLLSRYSSSASGVVRPHHVSELRFPLTCATLPGSCVRTVS